MPEREEERAQESKDEVEGHRIRNTVDTSGEDDVEGHKKY